MNLYKYITDLLHISFLSVTKLFRFPFENAVNCLMKHTQIVFNPLPIAIILTRDEIAQLWQYLLKCDKEGFTGIYDFNKFKDREYMYQWHLKELEQKVFNKVINMSDSLKFKVKFSQIEQKTLTILFQRVECSLELQTNLKKNSNYHEGSEKTRVSAM